MGAPAIERRSEALAGPAPTAVVDGMEVAQAIQDVAGSVPLIAEKKTFVRVYLGQPSEAISVRGELRVARKANGPWTTVSSFGAAALDPARSGSTPAQLQSRRENLAFSLDFRLPKKFTKAGTLWFKLGKVRDAATGDTANITDMIGTRTATFVTSPEMRVRVINLRYTTGTPPARFAASKSDLEHLESWLTRAYPVPDVEFSSVRVDATATWPFTSGQANAQIAAIRALDVAGGRDPGTHYYGMVTDAQGFMRGSASAIPATPDPSAVASGPTGTSSFPWDIDGSYGDWYGGHELGHTLGRLHPGFCNGNSSDDPAYPFANGQLANADGNFTGLDVGDDDLGIQPAALPGTAWHDVMTYCDYQWLSSYAYVGIRNRLVAEEMLFPNQDDDDDDDDDDGASIRERAAMSGIPVHIAAVVNLTERSAQFAHVTPLPGPATRQAAPFDSRFAVRVHMPDGTSLTEPVVFKPDVCREEGDDETGLVDTVLTIDPAAASIELLLDEEPVAVFEAGGEPRAAEGLRLERAATATVRVDGAGPSPDEAVLTWQDLTAAGAGARGAGPRYAVQASTDRGRTWTTLSVGATNTSLPLDVEQFSDAEQVRFRVLTTNGFSQAISTTSDIPVEDL